MYEKRKHLLKIVAIYILAALVIVFLLVYYSEDQRAKAENNKENQITVKPETFRQEYRNPKGEIRLVLSYQYPNISGEYKGIDKANCRYTTLFSNWLMDQDEIIDSVSEEENTGGSKYGNEVSYTITYNRNNILSVLFEGYLFAGGAHGMPYRVPTNIDLRVGEEVDLTKLKNTSKEEIKKQVNDAFKKKIDQDKSLYWDNAYTIVEQTKFEDLKYYFTEDGIVFYFDPYVLAPYAAGFVEAAINY
ncbi:MAG: DUF4163 domain-containing protein [bacterium]|nr:DUF4163 domain-containing protein [bacterium]